MISRKFELVLLVPESSVEAVSDALDALDALSVSVEDAGIQPESLWTDGFKPRGCF